MVSVSFHRVNDIRRASFRVTKVAISVPSTVEDLLLMASRQTFAKSREGTDISRNDPDSVRRVSQNRLTFEETMETVYLTELIPQSIGPACRHSAWT